MKDYIALYLDRNRKDLKILRRLRVKYGYLPKKTITGGALNFPLIETPPTNLKASENSNVGTMVPEETYMGSSFYLALQKSIKELDYKGLLPRAPLPKITPMLMSLDENPMGMHQKYHAIFPNFPLPDYFDVPKIEEPDVDMTGIYTLTQVIGDPKGLMIPELYLPTMQRPPLTDTEVIYLVKTLIDAGRQDLVNRLREQPVLMMPLETLWETEAELMKITGLGVATRTARRVRRRANFLGRIYLSKISKISELAAKFHKRFRKARPAPLIHYIGRTRIARKKGLKKLNYPPVQLTDSNGIYKLREWHRKPLLIKTNLITKVIEKQKEPQKETNPPKKEKNKKTKKKKKKHRRYKLRLVKARVPLTKRSILRKTYTGRNFLATILPKFRTALKKRNKKKRVVFKRKKPRFLDVISYKAKLRKLIKKSAIKKRRSPFNRVIYKSMGFKKYAKLLKYLFKRKRSTKRKRLKKKRLVKNFKYKLKFVKRLLLHYRSSHKSNLFALLKEKNKKTITSVTRKYPKNSLFKQKYISGSRFKNVYKNYILYKNKKKNIIRRLPKIFGFRPLLIKLQNYSTINKQLFRYRIRRLSKLEHIKRNLIRRKRLTRRKRDYTYRLKLPKRFGLPSRFKSKIHSFIQALVKLKKRFFKRRLIRASGKRLPIGKLKKKHLLYRLKWTKNTLRKQKALKDIQTRKVYKKAPKIKAPRKNRTIAFLKHWKKKYPKLRRKRGRKKLAKITKGFPKSRKKVRFLIRGVRPLSKLSPIQSIKEDPNPLKLKRKSLLDLLVKYRNNLLKKRLHSYINLKHLLNKRYLNYRAKKYLRNRLRLQIRQTRNNLFVTLLSHKGNVLDTLSVGAIGFRGPRRATPFAASQLGRNSALKYKSRTKRKLFIVIKSPIKSHIKSFVSTFAGHHKKVIGILNRIPVAHNGLKAKKPRRL